MRARALAVLSVVAACRPGAPVAPVAPQAPTPTTLDPVAIDRWIAAELNRRGVVGASLVIVHDGATVLAKGYGTRTIGKAEPIDADTPFAIGSISKQLTCAAAMLVAEDGKLKLTDPVSKWYPLLVRAADITLDDLGAHLSGYHDYYPLTFKDARLTKPIAPDDLLARYAGQPLDFDPRNRHSYSNTNYVLLARIVEKASGVPREKLLEDRIFKPLKMTHTRVGPAPGAANGHARFLLGPSRPTSPEATGWQLGAMDLYASANDLARWDLAFGSGDILSDASRAAMTAIHHTNDGREVGYGCGLYVRTVAGERVLEHSGSVEGFVAYDTFIPRLRSAVILLTNDNREVSDLQDAIVNLLLDRPNDVPVVQGPKADDMARTLVLQLQSGTLDRALLSNELNAYLDDTRLADAATRLRTLGKLQQVSLIDRSERGGMEASTIALTFERRTLRVVMFRSSIGKVHDLALLD